MIAMNYTEIVFSTGFLAAGGIYAILLVTLLTNYHLWPPGEKTPPYHLHWGLVSVFNIALLATTYLTWNSWILPRPSTLVIGVTLALIGAVIFVRGAGAMESDETMGVTGDLYTDGPYAYSRNPQYVGMIIGLVGFGMLANSLLVAVLAAVHIGWVLLLPFAEEPHLLEEFDGEYEQYMARVPRFVGQQTFRALLPRHTPEAAPNSK